MRNITLLAVIFFAFFRGNLSGQQVSLPPPYIRGNDSAFVDSLTFNTSKHIIGVEFEGYPAGQVYSLRFEHHWGKSNQREVNFRLGYNRAFRYNWSGLNDDEQGGGFGISLGYRCHFWQKRSSSLFIGARADIWRLAIFWQDNDNLPPKGTTYITVFQPSVELGYRVFFSKNICATFYGGIGQEINIATKGKAVGQGGMYIWGATLGYTIN